MVLLFSGVMTVERLFEQEKKRRRCRKTEIEAGWTAEKRNKERINNLRESIEKSKDKVLAYDEKLVRYFIKEIKIFPDKLAITVISGGHEDITI